MWRVLMLAVLGVAVVFTAAVAPTTCADAHAGAKKNACITNLRSLRDSKADWAKSFGITNLDVAPETTATNQFGWKQYLGNRPQCPDGGKYWIGRLGEPPRCSISGHTL
jgi:hypothetical protein